MLPSLSLPCPATLLAPASADPAPASGPLATLATSAALVALLALGGCATDVPLQEAPPPVPVVVAPPPPAPEPDKEPEDTAESAANAEQAAPRPSLVKHLLGYADRVAALQPNELVAEITRLTPRQDESAQQQLELAMALGQTRLPADTARALGLVQRALARKDNTPVVQSFARLLEGRFLQLRRLEDLLDKQTLQMRDAQRKNDQLNERLEAMRAIERSLNARPGGPAGAANGKPPVAPVP